MAAAVFVHGDVALIEGDAFHRSGGRALQIAERRVSAASDPAEGAFGVRHQPAVEIAQRHGEAALAESAVLPIAILETPCRFRDAALAALERDGRPYRVAMETPSLSALRAAVQAGLAVTCRTALFLPDRAPLAGNRLPPLPDVAYVQRVNASPHSAIDKLAQLVHAAALAL